MNKRRMTKTVGGLIASLFLIPALGLAQDKLADQKKLFDKNCKKCHGEDGTGKKNGEWLPVIKMLKVEKNPEVLNLHSDAAKKLSQDDIKKIILDGKDDKDKGKMKALNDKVTEDEAKEIAEYVHGFQTSGK